MPSSVGVAHVARQAAGDRAQDPVRAGLARGGADRPGVADRGRCRRARCSRRGSARCGGSPGTGWPRGQRQRAGSSPARSWPSMRIRPLVGWYRPHSSLTRVDLPAPFSPTRARTDPAGMSMRDAGQHRPVRAGVGERDVLQRDPAGQPARKRLRGSAASGQSGAAPGARDRSPARRRPPAASPIRSVVRAGDLQQRQHPEGAGDLHAHLYREGDHEYQVADGGVPVQRAVQFRRDGAAVAEGEEPLAGRPVHGGLELGAPHRRGHLVPGAPLAPEDLVLGAEQPQFPDRTRCWSRARAGAWRAGAARLSVPGRLPPWTAPSARAAPAPRRTAAGPRTAG